MNCLGKEHTVRAILRAELSLRSLLKPVGFAQSFLKWTGSAAAGRVTLDEFIRFISQTVTVEAQEDMVILRLYEHLERCVLLHISVYISVYVQSMFNVKFSLY